MEKGCPRFGRALFLYLEAGNLLDIISVNVWRAISRIELMMQLV
jgi:hypothetical protein